MVIAIRGVQVAESAGFDLHCERAYVRALRAMARRHPAAADLDNLAARLRGVEHQLAAQPPDLLARRTDLAPLCADFVWTAAALAIDPRIAPHVEALGGPHARKGLSASVFVELASPAECDARALVHWLASAEPLERGLLVDGEAGVLAATRAFAVPPRVLDVLAGRASTDTTLARVVARHDDLFCADHDERLALIARALDAPVPPVVIVEGAPGSGRRTAVARAAARPLAVLDATTGQLAPRLLALAAEATLCDVVPVIANVDELADTADHAAVARFCDRHAGPIVLTTREGGFTASLDRPIVRVRWPIPDVATRSALWTRYAGIDATGIAQRYPLGPGGITRAVASARAIADGTLDETTLVAGVRHNIAERMSGLAHRVEVTQSWDDVVLADDTWDQICALIARVRHAHDVLERWQYRGKIARGLGVPILFSGPPGTGKTMVASLIARELDLELYQVDLSQVVSKWIGETEKHLGRLFDAAEDGHALLLFDEADALFGQRSTEMRGATDRYANLEVNYLLQRVEAFGGITILTTNLDASIDRALKRRLAAHIVFNAPDDDERIALWRRMITTDAAPLAHDIDLGELSRMFPTMTGANIRNAALSAAYLAAADGNELITQRHLERAGRSEYRSMGHVLAERVGSRRRGGV